MGGSVAVTVRDGTGRVHRMTRSTNALPYWFNRPRFYEKDPAWLAKYVNQWRTQRRRLFAETPWRAEGREAEVYRDRGRLAPTGYGLMVADVPHERLLSWQSYTSFTRINGVLATHEVRDVLESDRYERLARTGRVPPGYLLRRIRRQDEDANILLELFEARRLTGAVSGRRVPPGRAVPDAELYAKTPEEFLADWEALAVTRFAIDTRPFAVAEFPHDAAGLAAFRAEVRALGFTLTGAEERSWDEFTHQVAAAAATRAEADA